MVTQERLAHLAQFTDEHLAYHEAGHAVVHHLQGGTVLRLSIERTDTKQGMHPVLSDDQDCRVMSIRLAA